MHDRYERFFAPRMLIGVNIAFILAAEFAGGGKAFYVQGLIHVPVLLFTLLACTRIFGRFNRFDPALKRFLTWTLVTLAIQLCAFAAHFVYRTFGPGWPVERVFGLIVSFQLASLLTLAFATFNVLQSYGKLRLALPWVITSSFIGAIAFCAALATFLGFITNIPPMLYMGLAAATGLAVAVPLHSVEQLIPVLQDFARYVTASAVFLALGAGVNTINLVAQGNEIITMQAAYVSHFTYFIAASFLFLGLGKIGNFGGSTGVSDRK